MCYWFYVIIVLNLANLITGQEPKTTIVRAGAASIAAASKLYENDFRDITVLEAENRIGGQIFTTRFESLIDLGAQRVVREINNIVFQLVEPFGLLKMLDRSPGLAVVHSKGCPVSTEVVMFAGEATSFHHFLTVHGVIELSGFREAIRLIDLYNKRKKVSKRSMKIFKNVSVI